MIVSQGVVLVPMIVGQSTVLGRNPAPGHGQQYDQGYGGGSCDHQAGIEGADAAESE